MKKRVVIIGAGFGGLSAACLLAKDGFDVTVVEKNSGVGGRAQSFEKDGFFFDMGPSWYLMPEVFDKFFATFGKKPVDYYKLKRLDPSYKLFFAKGDSVTIRADLKRNMELFESIESGAASRFKDYLAQSKYQYDTAMSGFIYRSYRRLTDFFSLKLAKEGFRLNLFGSLHRYTGKFFKSDRLRKILEYTVVFLGGNPKNTPALYSLMSHVDFNLGVWYPQGGMHAVARGMFRLAEELGVHFVFDSSVQRIVTRGGVASSVKTDKAVFPADIVVANADYEHVEQSLLVAADRSYSKRYWSSRTMAPSAFIMYLGIDRKVPGLAHHSLFLQDDWQAHFDEIFSDPKWPKNPSFYVCVPSKTDKHVAAEGMENLFVLVPVASDIKDTLAARKRMERFVFDRLEEMTGLDVRKHVVFKRLFAHKDFVSEYNAFKGTALGLAHTLRQTAVFRPSQRSRKVKNLYFSGQYTHPGIGVPMVIIASTIVSEEVVKNHG